MSKRTHRQYSEEFKRNALELVETSGKSANQIEQDLGLSAGLLHKWLERYQVESVSAGMAKSEVEQRRIQQLMRHRKPRTTWANPAHLKFPNLLVRQFEATRPNEKWGYDLQGTMPV